MFPLMNANLSTFIRRFRNPIIKSASFYVSDHTCFMDVSLRFLWNMFGMYSEWKFREGALDHDFVTSENCNSWTYGVGIAA